MPPRLVRSAGRLLIPGLDEHWQGTFGVEQPDSEIDDSYINGDFVNNDVRFEGCTHHWTDELRSTVSYGYTHLDNTSSQPETIFD